GESAGNPCQLLRDGVADQQSLAPGIAEVAQAAPAVVVLADQMRKQHGVEIDSDLLAEGPVLDGVELVPQRLARHRHLQGAPGPPVGMAKGAGQPLAAVAEAVAEGLHDVVAAVAEHRAKCEAGERLEDAHAMVLPSYPRASDGPEKCWTAPSSG